MAVLNLSYFYKVGAVVLVHMNDSRLGYIGIPISLRDGSCTVAFLEVSITFVSKILDSQRDSVFSLLYYVYCAVALLQLCTLYS